MPEATAAAGAEAFQPAHRPESGFQPAMVDFDPVVLAGGIHVARSERRSPRTPGCTGALSAVTSDRPWDSVRTKKRRTAI